MDQHGQSSVTWADLEPPSPPHTGIRALSETPAWHDSESSCCVASNDVGIHGSSTDTTDSPNCVTRYTSMSLSRLHPLAPHRNPDTRSRDTFGVAEPEKTQSVRMENFLDALDEEQEDDLAELAKDMVPEELRSLAEQREASSAYGWQPINKTKTSRYSRWQLTFGGGSNPKGWQLVDNAAIPNTPDEGLSMVHISAVQLGDTTEEESFANKLTSNPVHGEDAGKELEDADEWTWINGEYFDHYGYLDYINNVEDRKHNSELLPPPGVKKSAKHSKFKVVNKNGVHLGLNESLGKSPSSQKRLASPQQPSKTSASTPKKEDRLTDDASQPARGTFEAFGETKVEKSPESSSGESGRWELLEGNIDAPRTGNFSPHKLMIKLGNIVTGEFKTLSYTEVEHDEIDWNFKPQIAAIIKWRTDVFHEHGLSTKKNMLMYTPLEDAWMTLFHRKIRAAIKAGHAIKLPGPTTVMKAFNAFFEGKALQDANGQDVGPRPARDATSIRGKLDGRASKIAKERTAIRALLTSDSGGAVFVPSVTEEELEKFQEDETFVVEDPDEARQNALPGSEGNENTESLPKRKREKEDAGDRDKKKAKKGTQRYVGWDVNIPKR